MSRYVVFSQEKAASGREPVAGIWKEIAGSKPFSSSAEAMTHLRTRAEQGYRYRVLRVVQEVEFTKVTKVVTSVTRLDSSTPRKRAPKAEPAAEPVPFAP